MARWAIRAWEALVVPAPVRRGCFVENYPMSSLLQLAYDVHPYQISGPVWLDDERFTHNAKAPPRSSSV